MSTGWDCSPIALRRSARDRRPRERRGGIARWSPCGDPLVPALRSGTARALRGRRDRQSPGLSITEPGWLLTHPFRQNEGALAGPCALAEGVSVNL